ncbi:spore coat protein GerQ [Terrilactibacillus sp. BCM23-1]|uniref:Spore coat protein GerQ n=2 Tax=Terrilactibacillus tamarindi TaxID=2599694 RepID=A0A6N8CLU3_9BACI|nr:spore coat protein GerQ [Terrilactibacillus tamarindi]
MQQQGMQQDMQPQITGSPTTIFPGQSSIMPGTQQQPTFQQQQPAFPFPSFTTQPSTPQLPLFEQSYIENILRLNLDKPVTVYATFENNNQWNAKIFRGELEAAGRDHVIISESPTGTRYIIPMVFVNYVTFEGPISYSYPFGPQTTRE